MAMNGGILTRAKAKSASINIVVTRANGKVEDFGTVAYWHRNPLKRWAFNFNIWIRNKTR